MHFKFVLMNGLELVAETCLELLAQTIPGLSLRSPNQSYTHLYFIAQLSTLPWALPPKGGLPGELKAADYQGLKA